MEQFARAWEALAKVLRREMRHRGLWSAPPSFVGVYGRRDWREPGALDEITNQCFAYVFVQRLRSLKAQLEIKDNIDGLVFRNVRNFLHDLQKRHDPVGYRAYEILRFAIETALDDGVLEVVTDGGEDTTAGPRPALRGGTRLAFAGSAAEARTDTDSEADTGARELRRHLLEGAVAQWNAELLPDLVLARGRQRQEVGRRLAARFPELAAEGVTQFTFRELLARLRGDLRQRWAHLLWQARGAAEAARETVQVADPEDGEDTGFVRVLSLYRQEPAPGSELSRRQSFRRLTDCVAREVEATPDDERTRAYLDRLWQFLRTCANSSEKIPSKRKLAAFLEIPRDRMPELHRKLADYLRRCRQALRPASPAEDQDRENEGKGT